jgi:hypothetical protein
MGNNPVSDEVSFLGGAVIFAIFGVVAYRVGKFTVMPGELRRLVLTFGLLFATGGAIFLILPLLPRLLGSAADLVFPLVGLGGIAVVVLSRGRVAAVMARRSSEEQAEYARRTVFFRSRQGRWLIVALAVSLFVWALGTAFIWASP